MAAKRRDTVNILQTQEDESNPLVQARAALQKATQLEEGAKQSLLDAQRDHADASEFAAKQQRLLEATPESAQLKQQKKAAEFAATESARDHNYNLNKQIQKSG